MTDEEDSHQECHGPNQGAAALFLPLQNLFMQRPTFHPLKAWESPGKLN
jgi:hypothetical protein